VIETLSDVKTDVEDHYVRDAVQWGYQHLQAHQAAVIDYCGMIDGLKESNGDGKVDSHRIKLRAHLKHLLEGLDPEEREALVRLIL
jgi:hypothetical protein